MKKKSCVQLLILAAAMFSMLPAIVCAGTIPDTGQTKCYNNTVEIPCPLPGQPFYGQDAQYSINPHSYTDLGNGIVQDNVTGLEWQQATSPGGYTWQQAINYCNNLSLGGKNDWRLPTIKELSTLVDSSIPKPSPTINTSYFPDTKAHIYWSSTTAAGYTDRACYVGFYGGFFDYCGKSCDGRYVRAVRSGQGGASGDSFIDNGDGTVTDNATGLMWQQYTAPGTYAWQEALAYCESLTLSGYSDWRLPNWNELQSIFDYNRINPAIDTTYFPDTVGDSPYWSSTTSADLISSAWFLVFNASSIPSLSKSLTYYYRAVRGGFALTTTTVPTDRTSCVTYESNDDMAQGSALSCWTVSNDRVEFTFSNSSGRLSLCCSNMAIVQGYNQIPVQGEYYAPDINYATLHIYDSVYPVPIKECFYFSSLLAYGQPFGWIDSFPPSFKINDSFSIYYEGGYGRITIEIPAVTTSTTSIKTTTTTSIKTTTTTSIITTSTTTTTTILNHPPNKPTNPYPSNGTEQIPLSVMLSWYGGDPDSEDTVSYDVYFGTSTDFQSFIITTNNRYEVDNLLPATSYKWKVVARDNHTAKSESTIWTFTTQTASLCAAEAVLADDTESLTLLRQFRDEVLAKSANGKAIIKLYYEKSPLIVELIEKNPEFKDKCRATLKSIIPSVRTLVNKKSVLRN